MSPTRRSIDVPSDFGHRIPYSADALLMNDHIGDPVLSKSKSKYWTVSINLSLYIVFIVYFLGILAFEFLDSAIFT